MSLQGEVLNGTNAEHAQQVQALTAKLADFVTQAEQLSQSKLAAERQLQSEAAAREATQHQLETAEAAAVHADEAADSKIAEVAALKVCHLLCDAVLHASSCARFAAGHQALNNTGRCPTICQVLHVCRCSVRQCCVCLSCAQQQLLSAHAGAAGGSRCAGAGQG